ncbi:hypothetical protein [Duganella sp. BuS-21]|uniref:hypothetical protein n=1 Tax=Duganella sp. BuS-21 TaxID=2943848 RepID=UPI0035A69594
MSYILYATYNTWSWSDLSFTCAGSWCDTGLGERKFFGVFFDKPVTSISLVIGTEGNGLFFDNIRYTVAALAAGLDVAAARLAPPSADVVKSDRKSRVVAYRPEFACCDDSVQRIGVPQPFGIFLTVHSQKIAQTNIQRNITLMPSRYVRVDLLWRSSALKA